MLRIREQGLTFDDVLLVPKRTSVQSRKDIDVTTVAVRGMPMALPILSSNSPWCTESQLALVMAQYGGLGCIHRMCSAEYQAEQVRLVKRAEIRAGSDLPASVDERGRARVGAAVGIRERERERARLLVEAGADVLLLDVAHGHSDAVLEMLAWLKRNFPTPVIAGNVATAEGVNDLALAGADAVKVGIGPGSTCTTRLVTGAGMPQLTAVANCVAAARGHGIPIIADGGIRRSGDMVKALAVGASSVMLGGMLAGTEESSARAVTSGGRRFKTTTGYASLGMELLLRRERGEEIAEHELEAYAPEGAEMTFPWQGPARRILLRCLAGIRSGMSYGGAASLPELWEKSEFVTVSAATMVENRPHMEDQRLPDLHADQDALSRLDSKPG